MCHLLGWRRPNYFSPAHGVRFTWSPLWVYYFPMDLNNIILIAPAFQTHMQWLKVVFGHLKKVGLKWKASESELLQKYVKQLGRVVSLSCNATDPEKLSVIMYWFTTRRVKYLESFLSIVVYYRQYIQDAAIKAQPLHWLAAKAVEWKWEENEQISNKNL